MERRVAERKANFKKNFEDPRRKREDLQVQIRKTHREQNLAKKRAEALGEAEAATGATAPGDAAPFAGDSAIPQGAQGGAGAPGGPPELAGKDLQQLMAALASGNPDAELQATQLFRRALSIEHNPPIQLVIDAGAVPHFVRFLSMTGRENLQFEAAWALTNIASGTQEQTKVVIDCGAVPLFVELLRSPKEEVREQAVWALGNIAGDSPNCRNLVLDANALQPLLEQLNTPDSKLAMLRNATWTLSNFCRGKPAPAFDRVAPALPTLAALIYSDDLEVLTDACWALSYLSDGPNDRIEAVLQAGVCGRLVDLLNYPSTLVQTPALRAVGNIVTGDDRQTQVVLTCGAVPKLLGLLSSTRKTVQKEACWTISNITAGNRDQIQEVLDSGAIPALLHVLQTAEFDTKKEAAWAISNAVSGGSDAQVEALVRLGCVPPLCELISCVDSKIVMVALEALHAILRTGKKLKETEGLLSNPFADLIEQADGTAALEKLQDSNNEAIFKKVYSIISTYFPYEEEEEGVSTDMGVPGGLGDGSGFGAEAPQGGFKFG
ncbi:importin subunit alpha-1a [Cyclospora cayetanensis]|uniref:Importin subunit alpha n=1 Tax=Cyclospora cayetanensis TaxID=88456 RepID=A0A6P6RYB3_9EIME|nr:importin subunit alpha-1a [Cyclospora cayetanensis]